MLLLTIFLYFFFLLKKLCTNSQLHFFFITIPCTCLNGAQISKRPINFYCMTFQRFQLFSWDHVISLPFCAMSQENKPWYINLISGFCVLIKEEFTSLAGGITEHMDCWGMWQMATFNKASAFMLWCYSTCCFLQKWQGSLYTSIFPSLFFLFF